MPISFAPGLPSHPTPLTTAGHYYSGCKAHCPQHLQTGLWGSFSFPLPVLTHSLRAFHPFVLTCTV